MILARHAFAIEERFLPHFGGKLGLQNLDLRVDFTPLALQFAATPFHFLVADQGRGLVLGLLGETRRGVGAPLAPLARAAYM